MLYCMLQNIIFCTDLLFDIFREFSHLSDMNFIVVEQMSGLLGLNKYPTLPV
jgi:hypothetical protein